MNQEQINEKHLEFIQSAIARMGQNSFQSKTWGITMTSAIIAIFLSQGDLALKGKSICICGVLLILFCLIDTYYFYLECGFRKLYDEVAKLSEVSLEVKTFDMCIPKKYRGVRNYLGALCSVSTGLFYGIAILLLFTFKNFIIR